MLKSLLAAILRAATIPYPASFRVLYLVLATLLELRSRSDMLLFFLCHVLHAALNGELQYGGMLDHQISYQEDKPCCSAENEHNRQLELTPQVNKWDSSVPVMTNC